MIIKFREIPLQILMDKALLRRLPLHHPKRVMIESDLIKREVGFKGEESLNYYLEKLPQKDLHIFNDLRLKAGSYHFQMDSLLLTPHFLLIIEVKTISGTLFFDTISKQFIRTFANREEGFDDPLAQVEEQREQLNHWLVDKGFPSIPIEYIIGISNPETIVKAPPGSQSIFKFVLHFPHIKNRFREISKKYDKKVNQNVFKELSDRLLESHCPLIPDALKYFGIKPTEILTGTQCPDCSYLPMNRIYGKWHCPRCKSQSKDAHLQAINDYLLLVNRTITNKACQKFLLIDRHTSYKLLKKADFPFYDYSNVRQYYRK